MSKSIPIFGGGYTSQWRAQDVCRRNRGFMENGMLHIYPEARKSESENLNNDFYDRKVVDRWRFPRTQHLRGGNLT
jgi:hypothetical protein